MNFQRYIISLVFVLAVLSTTGAEKTKKVKKEFDLKSKTSLNIENKYGKVVVKNWSKNKALINILIKVESNKPEKLEKIIKSINISSVENSDYINIVSEFKGAFLLNRTINSLFSGGNLSIDYEVFVPNTIELSIKNKGDVFIDKVKNKLKIDVLDGLFKAQNIDVESNIKVIDGTINVKSIKKARILSKGTTVDIEKASNLNMESSTSKLNLKSVDTLNLKSYRDKVNIDQVTFMYGSSSWSKFQVMYLDLELDYKLKFGNMAVQKISQMFREIDVETNFGDLLFYFRKHNAYQVKIDHNKRVKLSLPDEKAKLKTDKSQKRYKTTGYVGKKDAFSKFKLKASNCKVDLD